MAKEAMGLKYLGGEMWRPSNISDRLHHLAEPVAQVIAKTRVTPNAITLLGFALNIGIACLLATGHLFLSGFLVLFAGIFDLLDGALARVTGRSTKFGALLDSTIDRYSEAVLLFGLLVYFYFARLDATLEMILIFATIVGSMLISYIRARAEGLGLDAEVGIMRRTVRIVTLAIGLILSPIEPALLVALWILAIFTNFTAAHRLIYVWCKTRKGQPE
jgi:CDP-diacylglycerol--glycerol-3-phosphate 3-phosphatidyltransferase